MTSTTQQTGRSSDFYLNLVAELIGAVFEHERRGRVTRVAPPSPRLVAARYALASDTVDRLASPGFKRPSMMDRPATVPEDDLHVYAVIRDLRGRKKGPEWVQAFLQWRHHVIAAEMDAIYRVESLWYAWKWITAVGDPAAQEQATLIEEHLRKEWQIEPPYPDTAPGIRAVAYAVVRDEKLISSWLRNGDKPPRGTFVPRVRAAEGGDNASGATEEAERDQEPPVEDDDHDTGR